MHTKVMCLLQALNVYMYFVRCMYTIYIMSVTLQEFVFPRDVAYPIGGVGNPEIVVFEVHYDNPNGDIGWFYDRSYRLFP